MNPPLFNWPDDIPVHEAIFQALGAASVCWNPMPTGVFDAQRATEIGEELLALLQRKLWADAPQPITGNQGVR